MSIFKTTMSWLGLGPDADFESPPGQQPNAADPGLNQVSPIDDDMVATTGVASPGASPSAIGQAAPMQSPTSGSTGHSPSEFSAVRSLGPVSDGSSSRRTPIDSEPGSAPTPAMSNTSLRPMHVDRDAEPSMGSVQAVPTGASSRPQIVAPRSFNDAQDVGDRFRGGVPVLLNLKEVDAELGRRFIDFCSGLCYGLRGQMQRVGDRVFLLIPVDVHLSAEDRRMLNESGLIG